MALRQPRRALVAVVAVAVAATLVTALLGISVDVSGNMARELRSYGANILVTPRSADLALRIGGVTLTPPSARGAIDESELGRLKTIFWRHNIVGFAPYLSTLVEVGGRRAVLTGTWFDTAASLPEGADAQTTLADRGPSGDAETFRTGVRKIAPWWKVQGAWARDGAPQDAMVGSRLARRLGLRPGMRLTVEGNRRTEDLQVAGIVSTGGDEEEQIFVPLATAQGFVGLPRGADRVLVSALVEPDSELRPDLRGLDPSQMTKEQYATWYCSPVMGAVTTQIEEVLSGTQARPIRRIAEAEGRLLTRIASLMLILTVALLAAAALAVMAAMTSAVLERSGEIGLMKSMGADGRQVALIFLSYAALTALLGGSVGYGIGVGVARVVGRQVFSAPVSVPLVVLPLVLVITLGVALAGSALPVRRAVQLDPATLLRAA